MTAVTDVHGNYYFTNLPPGTYTVGETNQSGWSQTFPGGGGSHTVNVSGHQVIAGQDFGNNHSAGPACCREVHLDVSMPKPNYDWCAPNHGYFITPKFTVSGLGNITQITADILRCLGDLFSNLVRHGRGHSRQLRKPYLRERLFRRARDFAE